MRRAMLCEEVIPFPEKRAAWVTLHGEEEVKAVEAEMGLTSSSPITIGDPASSVTRQDEPGPRAEARSQSGGLASTASEHSRPDKGPRVRRV